jgi:glyoxylase-like metal-dependent hydrolase (beta-lactamase superfamily II)
MARRPIDLGEGVSQFQSPLWQTNCLLVEEDREALLCDPSFTRNDVEELVAHVEAAGVERVSVLVTHADYDHVCGLGSFPRATVVAGADTAARISDGSALPDLVEAGAEWGIDWPLGDVRVDREARAGGELELGPFRVSTVAAPSHGREGMAFVLVDQGILFPGDHVSAITIPIVAGSLDRAIAANEALLEAMGVHDLRWIVPGHGPALTPAEAREICEADVAYLTELRDVARDAARERLSPGWALLRAHAVEPPRPSTEDFEVYGIRVGNARAALAEAARGGW